MLRGSPELEGSVRSLGPSFANAGLNDDEINTFLNLCRLATTYPQYQDLLAENRELADLYSDRIELLPLGYSTDGRRIEAVEIKQRGISTLGQTAILEAVQHATEQASVATARTAKRLFLQYPDLLARLGYDAIAVSDHADPDAMELQLWTRSSRPTVHQFAHGGLRGAGRSQLSWSYPTEDFTGSLEAQASLTMHGYMQPHYVGALHGSMLEAYHVVSSQFPHAEAPQIDPIVQVAEQLGVPVNYHGGDLDSFEWRAPGIYTFNPNRTKGSVLNYLQPNAVFHNPETPMMRFAPNNEPVHMTRAEAIIQRHELVVRRIGWLSLKLDELAIGENLLQNREAKRLYDSVIFWREVHRCFMDEAQQTVASLPPETAAAPISQGQLYQTEAALVLNSLTVAGNLQRLSSLAGDSDLANYLDEYIDESLPVDIGPAEFLPLDVQVCLQSLSSLVAMRRVAQ